MVKEEGLVVVGERHTKEAVLQDCNSYIKVISLLDYSIYTCHKRGVLKSEKCFKDIQDCNSYIKVI